MTKGYKIGNDVVSKITGQSYKISNKKNGWYFLETADGYIFATRYQNLKKYFDKVTQNVTNSNSEDLTELWKKGKLPSGYYYVKNEFGSIFPSDYSEDYDCISDTVIKDFFTEVSEIKEVLEPVPSYNELQKKETQRIKLMTKLNDVNNENHALRIENNRLKELLKDCEEYVKKDYGDYLTYTQSAIYQEIKQVLGEE